jgi:hypothetical protein
LNRRLRIGSGLLVVLVASMTVLPAVQILFLRPRAASSIINHRGALVFYPGSDETGVLPDYTSVLWNEYHKVKTIFKTYEVGVKDYCGTTATKQSFFNEISNNLRYYHFVGYGILSDSVPKLQARHNVDANQFVNIGPIDLYAGTQQDSLSGTRNVLLSCCYGMANYETASYQTSLAYVVVNWLGASSVIGSTAQIDNGVAIVFTTAFYDEVFNLGQSITTAFSHAKVRTVQFYDELYNALLGCWSLLISVIIGIVVSCLTAGAASIVVAMGLPILISIVSGLLLMLGCGLLKSQILNVLGVYTYEQLVAMGGSGDEGPGGGGGGGGEDPPPGGPGKGWYPQPT